MINEKSNVPMEQWKKSDKTAVEALDCAAAPITATLPYSHTGLTKDQQGLLDPENL